MTKNQILDRVRPRFESRAKAQAWYRSSPLAGFSGLTAQQMVRNGRRDEVVEYLNAIDAGVHA